MNLKKLQEIENSEGIENSEESENSDDLGNSKHSDNSEDLENLEEPENLLQPEEQEEFSLNEEDKEEINSQVHNSPSPRSIPKDENKYVFSLLIPYYISTNPSYSSPSNCSSMIIKHDEDQPHSLFVQSDQEEEEEESLHRSPNVSRMLVDQSIEELRNQTGM